MFAYPLRLLYCICLLLFISTTHAQVIVNNGKTNPHINYERLKRIDKLINEYVDKQWLAGAVTLIVKDGQVVQSAGYGYNDIAAKTPLKPDHIFRIASQTKAITSIALMMLYEEGKFMLYDPVSKFIPEFKNPVVLDKFNEQDTTYTTIPAKREVTIKDLLTHTSGLDYASIGSKNMRAIYAKYGISSGIGELHASLADKMKTLAKLPLANQPGEKFTYSLSTDMCGYLVELLSGMTLDEFLQKRLFAPLGMKDTYFNIPPEKHKRLAILNTEDSLGHLIKWPTDQRGISPDYPNIGTHYFSGGAGLSSTAMDYAIFLQMLLNKGTYNGVEILAPRTVEMILQNQLGDLSIGKNKFGLGFEIVTAKGAADEPRNEGSFAWGGYFGTNYWADPKENMVCLILTQQTPNSHGDVAAKFTSLVYQSLK
ncbi:serine hydrolase domain-containing protein [Foetidibacter luteolus]|uniref:serine hydrolase domain-containing protein n=1 Tax=Foetidibacter luteolus TaxID=2608880 RepID=UPI00129B3012|nr:serine hydrolase domain-containing protein [Foetidibacter luteolus]